MQTPKVVPIQIKEYTVKQSSYNVVGQLPIRSIILGPSGSGKLSSCKTWVWISIRIALLEFICSPSLDVDSSWLPVKKYTKNEIKVKYTDYDI